MFFKITLIDLKTQDQQMIPLSVQLWLTCCVICSIFEVATSSAARLKYTPHSVLSNIHALEGTQLLSAEIDMIIQSNKAVDISKDLSSYEQGQYDARLKLHSARGRAEVEAAVKAIQRFTLQCMKTRF